MLYKPLRHVESIGVDQEILFSLGRLFNEQKLNLVEISTNMLKLSHRYSVLTKGILN